ncbi:ABC transporter permease [Pseudonocardia hispaniensis]|uniref:Transport permease protein n=1 Tax=Pseudonocardia hispaniensis TaxID=904933 RepID=A0ABW1J7R6_9PSEU
MTGPSTAVVPVPQACGRVPGRIGGIGIVVEHYWRWYRRNWRATVVSSVLQPLLFLLAFGVGFGALVSGSGRVEVATGGVGYLVWLAPALLAMSAVQSAAFESTYPVLSGFKWQRVYHAMAAGPLTGTQIGLGHLAWIALRMVASGAVYVIVIAAFGGVTGPGIAISLLAATITGTAVAALVMAFAATVENEGSQFTGLFRFVVIPMTLFSGTFFPIDRLPAIVQPLAWVSPLWHGTELARSAALDRWQPLAAVGHVAYLLVLLVVGAVLVTRLFQRRLTP